MPKKGGEEKEPGEAGFRNWNVIEFSLKVPDIKSFTSPNIFETYNT